MAAHAPFERHIVEMEDQIAKLQALASEGGLDVSSELRELTAKLDTLRRDTYRNLDAMEQVQVARHAGRPYTLDFVQGVFTDWFEMKGDRRFRDDEAIVGGWARLGGRSVMVIGHQKGNDMKENLRRNFGMPHPEGYRKALRLMKTAEKFGRPVITLVDTPGAYPGFGAEERAAAFEAAHDDYSSILLKALADRLAEAFAEHLHERVRRELWGYAPDERLSNEELIGEAYRGIRPAPGYPACPDHGEKAALWNLLEPERTIGLRLTETFAMVPGAAVCGFYFSHPEARYFGTGKIARDQVEDYAGRKGWTLAEAERRLGHVLGYDPAPAGARSDASAAANTGADVTADADRTPEEAIS